MKSSILYLLFISLTIQFSEIIVEPEILIEPYPMPSCNCKKIDSGRYDTPYKWNSGHYMTNGGGERSIKKNVEFKENFNSAPWIMTSVSKLDSDSNVNLRVKCKVS